MNHAVESAGNVPPLNHAVESAGNLPPLNHAVESAGNLPPLNHVVESAGNLPILNHGVQDVENEAPLLHVAESAGNLPAPKQGNQLFKSYHSLPPLTHEKELIANLAALNNVEENAGNVPPLNHGKEESSLFHGVEQAAQQPQFNAWKDIPQSFHSFPSGSANLLSSPTQQGSSRSLLATLQGKDRMKNVVSKVRGVEIVGNLTSANQGNSEVGGFLLFTQTKNKKVGNEGQLSSSAGSGFKSAGNMPLLLRGKEKALSSSPPVGTGTESGDIQSPHIHSFQESAFQENIASIFGLQKTGLRQQGDFTANNAPVNSKNEAVQSFRNTLTLINEKKKENLSPLQQLAKKVRNAPAKNYGKSKNSDLRISSESAIGKGIGVSQPTDETAESSYRISKKSSVKASGKMITNRYPFVAAGEESYDNAPVVSSRIPTAPRFSENLSSTVRKSSGVKQAAYQSEQNVDNFGYRPLDIQRGEQRSYQRNRIYNTGNPTPFVARKDSKGSRLSGVFPNFSPPNQEVERSFNQGGMISNNFLISPSLMDGIQHAVYDRNEVLKNSEYLRHKPQTLYHPMLNQKYSFLEPGNSMRKPPMMPPLMHAYSGNHLPPLSHEQNSFLPPLNHEENSLLPPLNHEQNSLLPPLNHEQNSLLPPLNHEQNSFLPPLNHEENSFLPPLNHEQNSLLSPLNHEQNSFLPPLNHGQNSLLSPLNHEQNSFLPPLNHNQLPPLNHKETTETSRFTGLNSMNDVTSLDGTWSLLYKPVLQSCAVAKTIKLAIQTAGCTKKSPICLVN